MDKVKIGVLGAGAISGIYFKNLTKVFTEVEIIAVCDLFTQKAKEAAKEYKIPKVYGTMEEMLADEEPLQELYEKISKSIHHLPLSAVPVNEGKNNS